jgi:hypothetical protein
MLTNKEKKAEFKIELNNRFEALYNETSQIVTTEDHWQQVKQAFTSFLALLFTSLLASVYALETFALLTLFYCCLTRF